MCQFKISKYSLEIFLNSVLRYVLGNLFRYSTHKKRMRMHVRMCENDDDDDGGERPAGGLEQSGV